jgi:phosphatidylserine/phosphatidylglycerophosphate/cardiolipin synthase-like enzyme
MVTFALPSIAPRVSGPLDLDRDFAVLASMLGGADAVSRAHSALAATLLRMQTSATPAPLELVGHADDELAADTGLAADEITVLFGSAYYRELQRMIAAASAHVEVCMFHIALPVEDHPTRKLLDALVAARGRGVAVRVIVDRDRMEDPYRSAVINEAAVAYLRDSGVPVRVDAADTLLHSKFVVVDADLTLIGSHNWTAGSYFVFDDLTLCIASTAVASAQRARFDALWANAVDA